MYKYCKIFLQSFCWLHFFPMRGRKRRRSSRHDVARPVGEASIDRKWRIEEIGEEDSPLGSLSDDNILQILRSLPTRFLLSSPALVCRRWRRLCCSHLVLEIVPSPLSAYSLPWGSLVENEVLELTKCHALTLERIAFSGLKKLNGNEIISLMESCPHLSKLSFISCPTILPQLELIGDALPRQLMSFDVHKDHIFDSSCEEDIEVSSSPNLNVFIQKIQQRCPDLRNLDLDFSSTISIEYLDSLMLALPQLCSLHLQSGTIGWCEVSRILQSCSSLISISIVSKSLIEEQDSDDEDIFKPGPFRFQQTGNEDSFKPALFRLQQQMASTKRHQHLQLGLVAHKSLKSIRFYSSPHHSVPLDSMPLYGLLKESGQQLNHLHAQSLYNTSWHTVSVWCGNLRTLDLSHARAVQYSVTGIEEVILSGLPQLLKGLERLGLPSATDRVLVEIGRFCNRLKEIHFEGYASANVAVCNKSQITDRGVIALAEGCPCLNVISLAGCGSVTVSSLRALAFHCRQMKVLLLPRCVKINDEAIKAVWSQVNRSLLVLDLVGCQITSKTIRLLSEHTQLQGSSLRLLAIARSLWKSAKSQVLNQTSRVPSLRIVDTTSGLAWDGFFHAYFVDEMLAYLQNGKCG